MTDGLSAEQIQRDLPTAIVGRAVQYYPQLASTNTLAKQLARAGHPEGLLIITDEQTAGRGRLGRNWAAPAGSSLLLSLLLRPSWLAPPDTFALTMLASVALCEAVEQIAPIEAALKWPNDLLLPVRTEAGPSLRKAAGILSEIELRAGTIAWLVVGIGINVHWAPTGVIDGRDLALAATSVSAAAGQPIDRLALLRALLLRLDAHYHEVRENGPVALFAEWQGRLALSDQPIVVRTPARELRGIAEGVTPAGALRLRDADGVLHTVLAGDVGG